MPTLVFVLDAGASMATRDIPASPQPAAPLHSRFDCAKAAAETIYRSALRGVKLAHHSEPPVGILVVATPRGAMVAHDGTLLANASTGPGQSFESALKLLPSPEPLLSSSSETTAGVPPSTGPLNSALSQAFQLLSRQRWQRKADTPGDGRRPWSLDPGYVVLLTDGDAHRAPDARVQLPSLPRRDEELCSAPFRWDQQLYTLVLNGSMSSSSSKATAAAATASASAAQVPRPLAMMADATGGKHWPVAPQLPVLLGSATAAAQQMARGGVVVRLKPLLPNPPPTAPPVPGGQPHAPPPPPPPADPGALVLLGVAPAPFFPGRPAADGTPPPPPPPPCRIAGSGVGHWPLPEEFWVSRAPSSPCPLPPRPAHPTLWCASPSGNSAAACGAALDAWCFNFGLPVDWYEVAPATSDHATGAAAAAGGAATTTTAARLGLGALFPSNNAAVPPPREGQRLPVFVRNSGRQPGRGEPVGLLVCGRSAHQHHHQYHPHHSSSASSSPDGALVWRLALLPFGFPAVVAALRAGSPTTGAAGGGASTNALSDAQLAALVRALPAAHLAPLAAALQQQAQQPSTDNNNNASGSSGLLRGNRAVAPLLRLLGNALGPGGDAGPSSACRERWRRLTRQAESDVARATQQVDVLAACLPKRLAIAQRSLAQRSMRNLLQARDGQVKRACRESSNSNQNDGDRMSDDDEDGDDETEKEKKLADEEEKGREKADKAFSHLNLLPVSPPCFDAPSLSPFASTTAGPSPPHSGAASQALDNRSGGNNIGSSSCSRSASYSSTGGSGYTTSPLTEQEVLQLPTSHLLARWEAERRRLYGGRGLSVPLLGHCPRDGDPHVATMHFEGAPAQGGERRESGRGEKDKEREEGDGGRGINRESSPMPSLNLLELAGMGFRRANVEPIASMGAYQAVLAKTQVLRDPLDEELMAQQLPQAEELEWVRRRKSAVNFASPFRDPKTGQPLAAAKKHGLQSHQHLVGSSAASGNSGGASHVGSSSSSGQQGLDNSGVNNAASAAAGAAGGGGSGLGGGPLADELDVADGLGGLGGNLPPPAGLSGGAGVDEAESEEAMELAYLAADTPIYDPVASFAAASARADTVAAEPTVLPSSTSSPSSTSQDEPASKLPAAAAAAARAAVAPGGRHAAGLVLPPADAHRTKRRKAVPVVAATAAPAAAAEGTTPQATSTQAATVTSTSGRPPSPALEAATAAAAGGGVAAGSASTFKAGAAASRVGATAASTAAPRTPSPLPALSPVSVALSNASPSSATSSPIASLANPAVAPAAAAGGSNSPTASAPASSTAAPATATATATTTTASATDANKGSLAAALENGPADYSNLRLPEGWVVAFSRREQRHYFFNTATNTAAWVPPPGTTPL